MPLNLIYETVNAFFAMWQLRNFYRAAREALHQILSDQNFCGCYPLGVERRGQTFG